ncbi:MAG TPA: hypothetical protein VE673_00940 [Pseudonocardiaceae bacterium]|nr:hypothetical protein [Pseudonocardiaceae bacterium]
MASAKVPPSDVEAFRARRSERKGRQQPERTQAKVHDVVERVHHEIPNSAWLVISVKLAKPVMKNPRIPATT